MQVFSLIFLALLSGCNDQLPSRPLLNDPSVTTAGNITGGTNSGGNVSPQPASTSANYTPPATVSVLHPRCQSSSRCLYLSTPAYAQSASELASYVGRKLQISNYRDPGLCVPTAGAMALKGILNERHALTRLNNTFLESIPSKQWYEIVYKIGVDSNTDFINGGTWNGNMFFSFQDYFFRTVPKKSLFYHYDGMLPDEHTLITNSAMINSIKDKKFMYFIGADALKKEGSYGWAYDSGHAMVIKGFDGDRLHIQDPWGMDYFARIAPENVSMSDGITKKRQVFQYTGTQGYLGSARANNFKIALDEFAGISLD